MKSSIVQTLLLLYPAKWRNEYGAELEDLLLAESLRFTAIINVLWSALRQQVRPSNHPAGLIRPLARMTAGMGAVFVFSMALAMFSPLWRLFIIPITESGQTPYLMQNKWWEGFAVFWLGMPLLIAAFIGYPVLLCLVRAKLAAAWTPLGKRWATAFAICSGGLFLLGGAGGLLAWEYGVVLTPTGLGPLLPATTIPTVSAVFCRCAGSILAFGILPQIPVLAVFLARLTKGYSARG